MIIENWRVITLVIMVGASILAIAPNTDIQKTNLQFGLDISGGTRLLLEPSESVSPEILGETIRLINERANVYGLTEIAVRPIGLGNQTLIQVETSGIGDDLIDNLLSVQGNFEAKIEYPATVSGGKGEIKIGSRTYGFTATGENVTIEGKTIKPGENVMLGDINADYTNMTGGKAMFLLKVFGGEDIEQVFSAPPRAGINVGKGVYQAFFTVHVSPQGTQRFADVTKNLPSSIDVFSGEEQIDSQIVLFLDGKEVSKLTIAGSLKGQMVNEPAITVSRSDRNDAQTESLKLQTILRSGALPVKIQVVSKDVISPTLGAGFLTSAGLAGLIAIGAVFSVVFIRYRSIKIAFPMSMVGLSEVIIILGVASAKDTWIWIGAFIAMTIVVSAAYVKKQTEWKSFIMLIVPLLGTISWTVDLAAIAGVIAAIGTGINHQIIIADEVLRGRGKDHTYVIKEKINQAFFIVFGAAATSFSTLIPLLFVGTGLLRGFAITTMIGILGGYLVTRPAYGAIIEKLLKK